VTVWTGASDQVATTMFDCFDPVVPRRATAALHVFLIGQTLQAQLAKRHAISS
jgi:uncharacterized PurR-regulated membrane protein YhhQ (DUF165 family)